MERVSGIVAVENDLTAGECPAAGDREEPADILRRQICEERQSVTVSLSPAPNSGKGPCGSPFPVAATSGDVYCMKWFPARQSCPCESTALGVNFGRLALTRGF